MKALGTFLMFTVMMSRVTSQSVKNVDYCYDKCSESEHCKALNRAPNKKMKRCMDVIADRCMISEKPLDCLDNLHKSKPAKCSKYLADHAIPCLKCEISCEKCQDRCKQVKGCVKMDKASFLQIDLCEKLTKKVCGPSFKSVACLLKIKDMRDKKCPKRLRKNVLDCWKCEEKCLKSDTEEEVIPEERASNEQCLEKCSETESCRIFDSASTPRMNHCQRLTQQNCGSKNNISSCLEDIKHLSNINCPKEFRNHAITCLKCDDSCSDTSSQGRETMENEFMKCMNRCDSIPECKTVDAALDTIKYGCAKLIGDRCNESKNLTQCIIDLDNVNISDCPVDYRKSSVACMICEERCEMQHEGFIPSRPPLLTNHLRSCLDNCSKTASCIAMDNATPVTADACEMHFEEPCGSAQNFVECVEKNKHPDEACPLALQNKVIDCMKCDRDCEATNNGKTSNRSVISSVTKAQCIQRCHDSDNCARNTGVIKSECAECTKRLCGERSSSTCILHTISNDCQSECFVKNKQLCDKCKVECDV